MDNEIYCFLCGSELSVDLVKEEAFCVLCVKEFEIFCEGGELKGMGVKDVKESG